MQKAGTVEESHITEGMITFVLTNCMVFAKMIEEFIIAGAMLMVMPGH